MSMIGKMLLPTLAAVFSISTTAVAQTLPIPPVYQTVDRNGVDVETLGVTATLTDLSVGGADRGLRLIQALNESSSPGSGSSGLIGIRGSYDVTIFSDSNTGTHAVIGNRTYSFPGSWAGAVFTSDSDYGVMLDATNIYQPRLYERDGTYWDFRCGGWQDPESGQYTMGCFGTRGVKPSGLITRIYYGTLMNGGTVSYDQSLLGSYNSRVANVETNTGYKMQFEYKSNSLTQLTQFKKISGFNSALFYCLPSAVTCANPTGGSASILYDEQLPGTGYTQAITRQNGETVVFKYGNLGVNEITAAVPGTLSRYFSRSYVGGYSLVASRLGNYTYTSGTSALTVQEGGYTYPGVSNISTDEASKVSKHDVIITPNFRYRIDIDPLGRATWRKYSVFMSNLILQEVNPRGGKTDIAYDSRQNPVMVTITSANPGSPPSLVHTANYNASCTSITLASCNSPLSVSDASQRTTDFTYYAGHGQIRTETGPAVGGVRPQTRYYYTQRRAWIKAANGSFVPESAIWLLTSKATCRTTAANEPSGAGVGAVAAAPVAGCASSADEVVTQYDYGPDSGPNNLELRGIVEDATGAALRTCYSYDWQGNKISQTSARAGLASCY